MSKAILTDGVNYLKLDFKGARAELKAAHEANPEIMPPIYKDIDSKIARYRKAEVEEYELSEDGTYIEVRFTSGFKMQFSYLFVEGTNSNEELLATLDSYLDT